MRWIVELLGGVSAVNPFDIFLFNLKSAKLFQTLPAPKRIKLECSTTSKIEEQTQANDLLFYFLIFTLDRDMN